MGPHLVVLAAPAILARLDVSLRQKAPEYSGLLSSTPDHAFHGFLWQGPPGQEHDLIQRYSAKRTEAIAAPSKAARGRVASQAPTMVVAVPHRPLPVAAPIPKRAPQDTWVVDTGSPK